MNLNLFNQIFDAFNQDKEMMRYQQDLLEHEVLRFKLVKNN
jgi:hypothetical protein